DRVLARRALAALVRSHDVTVHVVGVPPDEDAADAPLPAHDGAGPHEHARLADVPGPVELAVVALPPPDAIDAVRQLARLGVRGVVVLSAG
ncbi:hypothetical protein GN156_29350, partial [bacterium LRH843]|nr:hypothetical protein [bacterium LRH843]